MKALLLFQVAVFVTAGSFATAAETESTPSSSSEQLISLVTGMIILDALPEKYVDEKKWGSKHDFTEGVKFRGKLKNLKVERRRVSRNHGTWKRYKAKIKNPDKDLMLEVKDIHFEGNETWLTIVADVKLEAEAELQQWVRGAKLMGISVVATPKIQMTMLCKVSSSLKSASLLGLITQTEFVPEVVHTDLKLVDFRLNRIGPAHGPVVRELGNQLESRVKKEVAKQGEKLTASANKTIKKELDKGQLQQRLISALGKSITKIN